MYDLKEAMSLTKMQKQKDKARFLTQMSDSDLIIYPAKGEEKGVLNIFTDTSCPYCTKLHNEIPALQEKGVTIKYSAFPRGGKKGPGYNTLASVWCSEDREKALDLAFKGINPENKSCSSTAVIDAQYKLGVKMGIQGTPASFTSDGKEIAGFMKARKILLKMGL
jgi:thiol:disulfide interchange protein DsbC